MAPRSRAAHPPFLLVHVARTGAHHRQHCAPRLGNIAGQPPCLSHAPGNGSPLAATGRAAALDHLPPPSGGGLYLCSQRSHPSLEKPQVRWQTSEVCSAMGQPDGKCSCLSSQTSRALAHPSFPQLQPPT